MILFFVLCGGIACFYLLIPESPEPGLKKAREAISDARNAEAAHYAPDMFKKACINYDSAMANWKAQNERFILSRDYTKVAYFTAKAIELATNAQHNSAKKVVQANNNTGNTVAQLDKQIQEFEDLYSDLPLSKQTFEHFNRAKMFLSEAKIARKSKKYQEAEKKLFVAKDLFVKASDQASSFMNNYFSDFSHWESCAANVISESKNEKSAAIVVEKLAQKCYVYSSGKLVKTYKVEFGPNWLGEKLRRGDKATPEGIYRITQKKDRVRTIYHKALLLNYPNQEDRARFQKYKKAGRIPVGSDIGGLIEIHGHGGKDFHWTNGCVALTNEDIDTVYKMVAVNTPVAIVGSLKTFENWKNGQLSR